MLHDVLVALCLMLVLEGMIPFISPRGWRDMIRTISQLDDRHVRALGLTSMLLGTGLLYLVN